MKKRVTLFIIIVAATVFHPTSCGLREYTEERIALVYTPASFEHASDVKLRFENRLCDTQRPSIDPPDGEVWLLAIDVDCRIRRAVKKIDPSTLIRHEWLENAHAIRVSCEVKQVVPLELIKCVYPSKFSGGQEYAENDIRVSYIAPEKRVPLRAGVWCDFTFQRLIWNPAVSAYVFHDDWSAAPVVETDCDIFHGD